MEGSYHGKEGFLVLQSGSGVDFRRSWTPSMIRDRHRPKWFLVRHSYIVCVEGPENMDIYDIFLVDQDFSVKAKTKNIKEPTGKENKEPEMSAVEGTHTARTKYHHTLKLYNSERKWRLLARDERHLAQFQESIRHMLSNTLWSRPNRYDSFAPVRHNVFAQWLVDGRDYMWNVSRAISMAKDVIFIHDWWLSPELYMRRPAAISQRWRLDRLLQRKAEEGVKVFVMMYRNIESAISDRLGILQVFHFSTYTPMSMCKDLPTRSDRVHSSGHITKKICIVDHNIGFLRRF